MSNVRLIAKQAGVSIATVSRVLNNHASVGLEVRTRVLGIANKLGYVSSVGRRATLYIAFAYTGPSSFGSPFDASVFAGLSSAMDESGFDLAVLNLPRDKKPTESYTQLFMRKGVRGVILRTTERTRGVCREISEEDFPAVVVGSHFQDSAVNYVYGDSLPTSKQAIEHLISMGHKRIGITVSLIEDSDHADRLEGYRQALSEHGLDYDPLLVFRVPAQRPDGAQLIRRVMSDPVPPTALFITDPVVVGAAVSQAHRMGLKIPEDLSILGFDDGDDRSDIYPRLSAVCQDSAQLGYQAFTSLVGIIQSEPGERKPVNMAVPTWLEVHDTTGKPPNPPVRFLPDGLRVQASPQEA